MNRLEFGNPQSKAAHVEQAKHATQVQKALDAMRQLGHSPARRCDIPVCGKYPWEAEDNTFPCFHLTLYPKELRPHGLDVLNAAARLFVTEQEKANAE